MWEPTDEDVEPLTPVEIDEIVAGPLDTIDVEDAPQPAARTVPTAEQEAAIATMIDQPFVDLSGTAGVGKTFIAKLLAERVDGVAMCATTGIAAVNLGEGQTINSLLMYYNTDNLRESFTLGYLQSKLRKLRRAGLRKILLDEKSMMDGHQLTFLVRAIDEVNEGKVLEGVGEGDADQADEVSERRHDDDLPPLGLILVGDFGQLPPIKAPFAFESAEWPRFADHRVKLTTIMRQTDRDFITALHQVRAGHVNRALEWFTESKFSDVMDESFDGTTVFAKNESVDRFNQLRLDSVRSPVVAFSATRWGKENSEWKNIPPTLDVKVGALVMVLANRRYPREFEDDTPPLMYCNGDLGVIESIVSPETIKAVAYVRLRRTGGLVPVQMVTRDNLVPLDPGRRKELREAKQADRIKDKYEIVGQITYMPLRLAWGTTVHKSQGLSLDTVQINIRDYFFGHPSMLFVALSRARTPAGLRIVGNQRTFVARCAVNKLVVPWL